MTYIVPAVAGATGYAATVGMGHPTMAIFVGLGCAGMGFLGRFAGNGLHLSRSQMRKVEHLTHRALAANWGVRPLTQLFTEQEQQKLIGSVFDAVAGEPMQELVEQWPILWAHIQRVHFSGIVPLSSLRAMRRAYRPGLFGKDKGKARELAQPVADAYAMLHPSPSDDVDWFMRWSATIGLPEQMADQIWSDTMNARTPRPVVVPVADPTEDDDVGEVVMARPIAPASQPRPQVHHLSDDEIERRMAAGRR